MGVPLHISSALITHRSTFSYPCNLADRLARKAESSLQAKQQPWKNCCSYKVTGDIQQESYSSFLDIDVTVEKLLRHTAGDTITIMGVGKLSSWVKDGVKKYGLAITVEMSEQSTRRLAK